MMATVFDGYGHRSIEGDLIPFRISAAARQLAIEKSALPQTPEWDAVQLFRAKIAIIPPMPPKRERPGTRTCHACGSTVKIPRRKERPRRSFLRPRQKWWLYYGPNHMTGGFPTKQAAMDWYLGGGR